MRLRATVAILCVAFAGTLTACVRPASPPTLAPLPFATDTLRTERIAEGVWHRYLYVPSGPWAIHVLDVDLTRCNEIVAVKGADTAAGRVKTTDLLAWLARKRTDDANAHVVGGVNADFFSLANGTPTGLLVVDGQMITALSQTPSLAVDAEGKPRIDRFALVGGKVAPFYPLQAVGGHPMLLRDSAVTADVDTAGNAGFIGRNPRTAVGVARDGKRLLFAVIDGRQKGYSDGTSLRETATLLLALGARDALNLDGGGSSTLVFADPGASGALRIANRPSDAQGERAVGDAVAVVSHCRD